jgi:hypothetical protein
MTRKKLNFQLIWSKHRKNFQTMFDSLEDIECKREIVTQKRENPQSEDQIFSKR